MPDVQTLAEQLYQQGRALRIRGEYDQAVAALQRAIDEDPNHASAHGELGLAYCFTGLFDESIQELELAAGLDPADPEIRLNLGKTYTMLGMYEEGGAAFRAVLQLCTPDHRCYAEAEKQLAYF